MSSDILKTLLDSVEPGEPITQAVKRILQASIFPKLGRGYLIQIYVLFSLHICVLLFSSLGIFLRWYRRELWFFQREVNGVIKPNTANISQMAFALNSLLLMAVTPTDFVAQAFPPPDKPPAPRSGSHYAVYVVSFIPLLFGLYFLIWATVLAPTTSLRFLNTTGGSNTPAAQTSARKKGNMIFAMGIGALGFILATLVPWIGILANDKRLVYKTTNEIFNKINEIESAGGTITLASIIPLMPDAQKLAEYSDNATRSYYGLSGTGVIWLVVILLTYIPCAIRLLRNIHASKRRLQRSIKSLTALNDLVTQPVIDAPKSSVDDPIRVTINIPARTQAKSLHGSLDGDRKSQDGKKYITEAIDADFQTGRVSIQQPKRNTQIKTARFSEKVGEGNGSSTGSNGSEGQNSQSGRGNVKKGTPQLDELNLKLIKTRKIFFAVASQFIITSILGIWSSCIIIYFFTVDIITVNKKFILYSGWSFGLPTFIASAAFCWFCLTAPGKPNQVPRFNFNFNFNFFKSKQAAEEIQPGQALSVLGSERERQSQRQSAFTSDHSESGVKSTTSGALSPYGYKPAVFDQRQEIDEISRAHGSDSVDIPMEDPSPKQSRWVPSSWATKANRSDEVLNVP